MIHLWISFRDTEVILNINNCLGQSTAGVNKKDRRKDREEGASADTLWEEVAVKGRRDVG